MDKKIVDIFSASCKVRFVLKFKPFLEKLWIKNKIQQLKLLLQIQKTSLKNQLLLNQAKTSLKKNLTGNQLVLGHFCPSFFSSPFLAEIHFQKMGKGEIIRR
jgi:hypothetical protein